MSYLERLLTLDKIIEQLGQSKCEEIKLSHQVVSMSERIGQMGENDKKPSDSLIKVMDKRRYTRERLTEVRVEIQELETEKERLKTTLEYGDE